MEGNPGSGRGISVHLQSYLHLILCPDLGVRMDFATRSDTPPPVLELLACDANTSVAVAAIQHLNHTSESLSRLSLHSSEIIRLEVTRHPNTNPDTLLSLLNDESDLVSQSAVSRLLELGQSSIHLQLITSGKLSRDALSSLLTSLDGNVRERALEVLTLLDQQSIETFYFLQENVSSAFLVTESREVVHGNDVFIDASLRAIDSGEGQLSLLTQLVEELNAPETKDEPNFALLDLQRIAVTSTDVNSGQSVSSEYLLRSGLTEPDLVFQSALEIGEEMGWRDDYQKLRTLLDTRSESSLRYAVRFLKHYGISLEELILASALRNLFDEHEEYNTHIRYGKFGWTYDTQYNRLSWKWALTIVRGFPNYPDPEELHQFIDEQFDWWRRSNNCARQRSFILYLYELAEANPANLEIGCLLSRRLF